jgi:nucleotide-binding universal stress UspA family protein
MLADALPAELVLLRAVSLPSDVTAVLADAEVDMSIPLEQLEAQAQVYLDKVADRLEEAGLTVQRVVRLGPAPGAIVDYADQVGVQQIVMATHGYSGISRWVHGSVAERVLQSASVPVLLVRAGEKKNQPMTCRHILVPLDGSPVAEQVLAPVAAIARALDARLVLLSVPIVHASGSLIGEWYLPLDGAFETTQQTARAYLDRVAEQLQAQGMQVSTAMRTGAVADSIVDYAEANQIDLIAMCTHGRTGLGRWTLGSVADRVLRAGGVPILLVRAR